jgi:CcmD family protein
MTNLAEAYEPEVAGSRRRFLEHRPLRFDWIGRRGPPRGQLIRRRGREKLESVSSLGYLAAVNVVIWVGLFLYLWRLDRRISESEPREIKK